MNYHKGDLLSVDYGIIVHGCNAQGVMGSGVAKAIKEKYPEAFKLYREHCLTHSCKPYLLGDVVYCSPKDNLWIANAITQVRFGNDGKKYVNYDAVDCCFKEIAQTRGHLPIHFPKIGAGLGGGDWNVISAIIDKYIPDGNCWILE